MPSILESVTSLLGRGEVPAKLGSLVGGDAKQAETAVETAGPALLGALAEKASGDGGQAAVIGLLDAADASVVDDPGRFFDRLILDGGGEGGETILSSLFGAERSGLLDGLASRSGLGEDLFAKLLPALAPVFLAVVARRRLDDGLDAPAVVSLVEEEREGLETDGKLGDWFSNIVMGGRLGEAIGKLEETAEKIGEKLEEIGRGSGYTIDAAIAEERAVDDAEGDDDHGGRKNALVTAGATAVGVSALTATTSTLTATASTSAVEGGSTGGSADRSGDRPGDRPGDNPGDSPGDSFGDRATDGGADTPVEEATPPGGAKAVSSRTEPARGNVGGGASALVARMLDRGRLVSPGSGAGAGWVRWALGAAALVAVLAFVLPQIGGTDPDVDEGADSGTPAAPTTQAPTTRAPTTRAPTTRAPTTRAPEVPLAGADLDVLVQEALTGADLGTGVTATVADSLVTLSGSVATEEARGAAEAAVAAVGGVTGVDNQVTVDGSESVASGSGTSLNDRLGLAPITFRYLSARITPQGEKVLADVVAHLAANPGIVEIQGHTDSDGGEEKNLTLSQKRAESVKAFLVSQGIEADRLTTVGFGESSPKAPNDSAENKAVNRRIELIVN